MMKSGSSGLRSTASAIGDAGRDDPAVKPVVRATRGISGADLLTAAAATDNPYMDVYSHVRSRVQDPGGETAPGGGGRDF